MTKLFRPSLIFVLALILGMLTQACGGQSVAKVGSKAPDFRLPNALGGEVSMADFEGTQPVLLFFHMAYG